MENLGKYNDRLIAYLKVADIDVLSNQQLPSDSWLALIIGDKMEYDKLGAISSICLNKNVAYMCALGNASESIHDLFDQTMVANRIEKGLSVDNPEDFENEPMTTWHDNFGEGVWFSLTSAYTDHQKINQLVCIDLTEQGVKQDLIETINRILDDWLPDD